MPIHGYPGNVITANPTAPTVSSASGVWTTEQQLLAVSQGNWPGYEYPISRSLRFNSADSAYLNRTFTTPTDTKKFTWSGWVKRGSVGVATNWILSATPDAYTTYVNFGFVNGSGGSVDYLTFDQYTGSYVVRATTNAIYRDTSAWYHIVLVWDSANATSTDRTQIWVNGLRTTVTYAFGPVSQNTSSVLNANNSVNYLGRLTSNYFNGYMTEVNFVDGQALTPSSFGLNDPETGVWSPKQYTGTYGTNGFYVNFSDNSNTTATTLGKDYSGNGNNWTPNNFSVTAGAGNDSLVDSPTSYGTDTGVGGEVRGNYCTLNPLIPAAAGVTLSDGNLRYTNTSGSANQWYTTFTGLSGAFYYEATCTTRGASDQYNYVGDGNALYATNGQIYIGGSLVTTVATYTSGDVIGVAFNGAGGSGLQFFKNGTQVYSASASGGNTPIVNGYNSCVWNMNFGQRAFAYTAPSGFKALCTQNLPTPTIGATSTTQANDYFDATTYTGNGSTQSVVNSGGFQPDLVWVKGRTGASNNALYDGLRGVKNQLVSNSTAAEVSFSTQGVTAFNSTGFTVVDNANGDYSVNGSGGTYGGAYVAWQWNAGGSTVTNTSGTISAQVRANTTSGFSIVTYTGTAANATVGHGLGVAPSMIITKRRTTFTSSWGVWHTSIAATEYLLLNSTAAKATATNAWNSTAPSSTVVSLGDASFCNGSVDGYVMYCFAPVAGYSAFGSYTGNGSADGPFVYTGFRPRYFMAKRTDAAGNSWILLDTARNTYNAVDAFLSADLSNAEATSYPVDFLSNGFKIRATTSNLNASSGTYIYMAFAESPFKYALAR